MEEPASPTYLEKLELLRIENSADVVVGSITLEATDDGEVLSFDLRTEPAVEPPKADVRDVERVCFVYRTGRKFGRTAPANVICAREDFPRNIGHLCSGPPGCPAAPCLAIGGIQPIYERGGIEAILERLRAFMRDAKTGSLMADGWEPVPFGVEQEYRPGQIFPRFFQEYALAHAAERCALGVAVLPGGGKFVAVVSQTFEAQQMREAIGARAEGNKRLGVPWIFLWPDQSRVERDPIFEDWRDGRELRAGLERIGVASDYDAAIGALLTNDCDFKHHHDDGRKSLVVIIGVWRPAPLMSAFFGYSDDQDARRLELRAYVVSQKLTKEIIDDDAVVEAVIASCPSTPDLLRWVSGETSSPPITLLGFGALGSAIFNNLARAGCNDLVVQDNDRLLPHNLARHSARLSDIHEHKAVHARVLAASLIAEGAESRVEVHIDDIVSVDGAKMMSRIAGRLIVDATADEKVRLKLDELRTGTGHATLRTEIFHDGRLGTTFVSIPDGPSFSDMMTALLASATTEPAVAAWLDYEAQFPLGPDPLFYGFGCGSPTVQLPNYVVEQHAAAALPSILERQSSSGIGLNPLDAQFRPLGWRWLPIEPFTLLTPPTCSGWSVRVSGEAMNAMKLSRQEALPSETGGYLYGTWDPGRQIITIVYASSLPPDSRATSQSLQLGPAGRTLGEQRLLRKTHGRLFLCGSWHSHPNTSAALSGKDYTTFAAHHEEDAQFLRPTLLVIVAEGDVQAHMKI